MTVFAKTFDKRIRSIVAFDK